MKGRLTQQDIANGVGVAQPTVQRWLTGTIPGGAEIYRLAKFLNVTVEHFFENGDSDANLMMMHETTPPPDQKKIVAKLRRQVQNMQTQIDAITVTLNELEP